MSRGLGRLQRDILAVLPHAETAGGYDLRAVAQAIASQTGRLGGDGKPTAGFAATFSRSIRSLIRRGYLRPADPDQQSTPATRVRLRSVIST
jgi:hypothetical protein